MNKFFYGVIALVSFLSFLVITAPASLLLGSAAEDIRKQVPDLQIGKLEGSLWSGSTAIQYLELPATTMTWSLSPGPLLAGTAAAEFGAQAEGLTASGSGEFTAASGHITALDAEVRDIYLNALTQPQGLQLAGTFALTDTDIRFNQRWLEKAAGRLEWSGGTVHIETPGDFITADLPPLTGIFSLDGEVLVLNVTADQVPMIVVRIQPTGWAAVAINYAFIDLAGIPLPIGSQRTAADPAILLEEKVF